MDYKERFAQASAYHQASMKRVAETPAPEGQKFPVGARVKLPNLEGTMRARYSGKEATVLHTYAHAFGGKNVKSYALRVEGYGFVAWWDEDELERVNS